MDLRNRERIGAFIARYLDDKTRHFIEKVEETLLLRAHDERCCQNDWLTEILFARAYREQQDKRDPASNCRTERAPDMPEVECALPFTRVVVVDTFEADHHTAERAE